MDKIQRIQELVKELNQYSYEYYTLSTPSISDKEYDEKYKLLETLESATNTILPDSPTQRVGDIVLDKFEKHVHKFKCYSMDKAQNNDELLDWDNRMKLFIKQNNLPKIQYVVMKKYDGLTINNSYDNEGLLIASATRGTGEKGELVTLQVKTIKSIPLRINNNSLVEIHGEVFMTKKAFNKYNEIAEVPLKNLRNGAAGAIKNLNVIETAKRNLSAFFYDVGYSEGIKFKTYIEMMDFIKQMGLPVDSEYYLCNTIEEVKEKINLIESQRPGLDYEIDGAIVSINDIQTRELMGYATKFPKWAIAYKYETEETTTELLDIEFNTGRTGQIAPRGILEPVELMNTTVTHATLNSMDDIKKKGVRLGATIFIRKSNDVIPEILGVDENSITDDMEEIKMPTHCQSCGSELVQDGVHYFCRNSLNCKAQIVKSIAHFGTIQAMNIDGFSEQTAQSFVENGIISSVLDLFSLEEKREKIIKLPKFGVKKYNNLIKSIENCKKVKLNQFIYSLGIDEVGLSGSKNLCEYFNNNIRKIMSANINELLQVKDFGDVTANKVYSYFNDEDNCLLVDGLLNHIEFIQEEKKGVVNVSENPFKGKTIYLTGKFSLKKDELKAKVEGLGAILSSGYKKSLDMLVCGGDMSRSGKADKAIADGVKCVSEEFLMQYLK
jgi:DNA ligase (NAD+)